MATAESLIAEGHRLRDSGDPDAALALYRQAILAEPANPRSYLFLGNMLNVLGFTMEARKIFAIGLQQVPDAVSLLWADCMATLAAVYQNQAEMAQVEQDFATKLRALRSACFASEAALAEAADAVGAMTPFFLPYLGRDCTSLLAEHGALVADVMTASFPAGRVASRRDRRPDEPIRVGVLTGLFRRHAVWRLPTRGWIETIDRSRFHLFGYQTRVERDDQTDYAESRFDRFACGSAPVPEWLDLIRKDAPDVLIFPEVGADQRSLQLAGLRLAPVQCTSWGHPVTSGLPTIDYYLSSDPMEPADGASHYTETLVRLPGLGTVCQADYAAWGDALPAHDSWAHCRVPDDAVRFACFQAQSKYLPEHDEIFPRIAQRLPQARFLFIGLRRRSTELMCRRLADAFARFGLAWDTHCRFTDQVPAATFSAMIRDSHVFLDTPEWSGCNTVLDALGHHIPIVTLPGRFMRGRHALAILRQARVTDTIVDSVDDYVAMAVRLGSEPAFRAQIRAQLGIGKQHVFGDPAPVRALEAFLTEAVARAEAG